MDRVACRGSLARAPGALKGDTSENVNIFVAVEGVLSENIKKLKGEKFLFSGKKSQCRKKLKGGTLWSRRVWYVTRENRKNLSGSVR